MNNFFIEAYDHVCKVNISDNGFYNELTNSKFWDVYSPDLSKLDKPKSNQTNTELFIDNNIKDIEFNGDIIKIPQKDLSVEDAITIIDYLYEAYRNIKGVYSLNSSSVIYKDSKAVIFFGGSTGMGKTTMARYFSNKENFKMFSDDKTLINSHTLKVIDGSRYIHLNKKSLKEEFDGGAGDHVQFNNDLDGNFDLNLFVYGYISTQSFNELEVWDKSKFEWHLYEALTKRIRGTSRRIMNGKIPLPSLDTQYLSKKRVDDVSNICSNIKCVFIKADAEGAYEKINEIIN